LLEGESVEDTVGTKVVAFLVGTHVLGAFVDGDGVGVLVGLRVSWLALMHLEQVWMESEHW
jgi:hypothetical protein